MNRQYMFRYRLNSNDQVPRVIKVDARTMDDALDRAFKYIDETHNLISDLDRESVSIHDQGDWNVWNRTNRFYKRSMYA
jgi:hypothetical protein